MNNEKISILEKILVALQTILGIYQKMTLSEFARTKIDTDFTSDTVCPDDVSCAYSVSTILQQYFKMRGIRFPIILGTDLLDETLAKSPHFKRITELKEGEKLPPNTVIVNPRTVDTFGHTGIPDDDGLIMNNQSSTGLWRKTYDRDSWRKEFHTIRGLPTRLYQVII